MPMAFTWEIYGNMTADFHDCFRMFNPVSAQARLNVRVWGLVCQLVSISSRAYP